MDMGQIFHNRSHHAAKRLRVRGGVAPLLVQLSKLLLGLRLMTEDLNYALSLNMLFDESVYLAQRALLLNKIIGTSPADFFDNEKKSRPA